MRAWIARDKTGNLYMHNTKPQLYGHIWQGDGCFFVQDELKDVTFENSPILVEVDIKLMED